ncbi:SAM-dependent methyltransferase [Halobacteriales archaeon QS_8_69_26]|nr:MAG: SAM-dependent methyltransferase [Halobacteriales archaeon QS_8_69_26]
MGSDPYGRAIRDHYLHEREYPLIDRDGADAREHPIERFYFREVTGDAEGNAWAEDHLGPEGPLLDMGAGVGRHALYFQEYVETVAIEVSDHLVETMRDRGVADARRGDMFDLRSSFDRDRFRSAFARGTQATLAGSMAGLRTFLSDLAHVTTPDATAVFDGFDPAHERAPDLLGYRSDPAPGLAYRTYHFEYEGDVGPTLLFRLFGPDRVREATAGTPWRVADVHEGSVRNPHYEVALAKGHGDSEAPTDGERFGSEE